MAPTAYDRSMLAPRIAGMAVSAADDEDDPLAGVVLALSGATAAMLAIMDVVVGAGPLWAVPLLGIVAGHALRRPDIGIAAAVLVWLRLLGLSHGSGVVTPLLMLGLCALLLVGPGRAVDWLEARWEARTRRRRLECEARLAAGIEADGVDGMGWIEELPETADLGAVR